jgi:hypothetical protein
MHVVRKARRIVVAVGAALAIVATTNPTAASAADLMVKIDLDLPLAVSAAAEPVINCHAEVWYPHQSSHVIGTVNTVGDMTCTEPLSYMYVEVRLYYSAAVIASAKDEGPGRISVWANAATTCVPGVYHAEATFLGFSPPGYVPPEFSFTLSTPPQTITCL